MILTVTLNPLLERRFTFNSVNYGAVNRDSVEKLAAGGKGINVSRQLNNLKSTNLALTFAGGHTGKIYKKVLAEEGINCTFIHTIDETRNGTVITDLSTGTVSTYLGNNTNISDSEADEFLSKLGKMISNCEILVLSGSSPGINTNMIFPEAIRIANKLDKISILDTYGEHLKDCLEAGPTTIHNNLDELKIQYPLSGDESLFNFMEDLYRSGIKQVYITNGSGAIFASNFDFRYRVDPPIVSEKDSTGSGDAFTAGVVYGWHNNLTFEETLNLAASLGVLNASSYSICASKLSEAKEFGSNINVVPVGKKMKTINVTPH